MTSTTRRLVAWVLLIALALSSAAPALASRLSSADLAAMGICSMAAHEAGGDATQLPQQDPAALHAMQHCAFCSPAAHAAVLPSLPQPSFIDSEAPSLRAPPLASPARAVPAGATWRPRGPPARA